MVGVLDIQDGEDGSETSIPNKETFMIFVVHPVKVVKNVRCPSHFGVPTPCSYKQVCTAELGEPDLLQQFVEHNPNRSDLHFLIRSHSFSAETSAKAQTRPRLQKRTRAYCQTAGGKKKKTAPGFTGNGPKCLSNSSTVQQKIAKEETIILLHLDAITNLHSKCNNVHSISDGAFNIQPNNETAFSHNG